MVVPKKGVENYIGIWDVVIESNQNEIQKSDGGMSVDRDLTSGVLETQLRKSHGTYKGLSFKSLKLTIFE